ncbi:hypothetical protein [Hymenobacter metallicola]|uniref:Uncharacterized protein n=1 Tax=Hymenobacter metallicola TaxID=2563114 RepID=A0A4Z0PY53_9BACT|nr:hypothetical protein [Hymenobacter metallicola]TGE22710.1 hypothetical protein E5K02_23555 [Hymenobacter metallicola]
MQLISKSAFAAAVAQLIDTTIEAVKAGVGTGSIFTLHLRAPTGEVCYLMVYCSWKLLRAGAIACTWQDPEEDLAAALSVHQGETLVGARLESGGDLVLLLATGAELKLFVDGQALDEPAEESYSSDYFLEQAVDTFVSLRGAFYLAKTEPSADNNV